MRNIYYLIGWGYVAICVTAIVVTPGTSPTIVVTPGTSPAPDGGYAARPAVDGSDAVQWFRRAKPYCNSVEIGVMQRSAPAPKTLEGAGYEAACYALAGRIDDARRIIDRLAGSDRLTAAGIVFAVGHPVADAGDDRAAGPIMELVIDYWPNHYMALYHAGMAEYMLGQGDQATRNLSEFLNQYHENDGWRANGIEVLRRLRSNEPASVKRPREPQ